LLQCSMFWCPPFSACWQACCLWSRRLQLRAVASRLLLRGQAAASPVKGESGRRDQLPLAAQLPGALLTRPRGRRCARVRATRRRCSAREARVGREYRPQCALPSPLLLRHRPRRPAPPRGAASARPPPTAASASPLARSAATRPSCMPPGRAPPPYGREGTSPLLPIRRPPRHGRHAPRRGPRARAPPPFRPRRCTALRPPGRKNSAPSLPKRRLSAAQRHRQCMRRRRFESAAARRRRRLCVARTSQQ